MKEIKIISTKETNAFANPAKANNGGGYSQPKIEFLYKGEMGTFTDTSCGEFGTRYEVKIGSKYAYWGTMLKRTEESLWNGDDDFIEAFNKTFKTYPPLEKEE